MHCLVIGGTRFIGPRVVRILHEQGWTVTVLHRGQHNATLPGEIREIVDPDFDMPVTKISKDIWSINPDVVLLMIAMGEQDSQAAMDAFDGRAKRIVAVSSGDVYRAYGRFMKSEPGAVEAMPLREDSPLRDELYPYRNDATPTDALEYWYEKILVERALMASDSLPGTVLRLPKVYGPDDNQNLATVFGFRAHPNWRWTHGHVDNVAHAISIAVVDSRAEGEIYNVGENYTPTVGERLSFLPAIDVDAANTEDKDMSQDIVYDTTKIRDHLGFQEVIDERIGMVDVALRWQNSV